MRATLDDVIKRFNDLWFFTKRYGCSRAPWPWDMTFGPLPGKCGGCANCIEVFGAMQLNSEVNYALFGCLQALCGHSVCYARYIAQVWKGVKYAWPTCWGGTPTHEWNSTVLRWLTIGWYYCKKGVPIGIGMQKPKELVICLDALSDPGVTVIGSDTGDPIVDNPRFSNCERCPQQIPTKPLNYDWFWS